MENFLTSHPVKVFEERNGETQNGANTANQSGSRVEIFAIGPQREDEPLGGRRTRDSPLNLIRHDRDIAVLARCTSPPRSGPMSCAHPPTTVQLRTLYRKPITLSLVP